MSTLEHLLLYSILISLSHALGQCREGRLKCKNMVTQDQCLFVNDYCEWNDANGPCKRRDQLLNDAEWPNIFQDNFKPNENCAKFTNGHECCNPEKKKGANKELKLNNDESVKAKKWCEWIIDPYFQNQIDEKRTWNEINIDYKSKTTYNSEDRITELESLEKIQRGINNDLPIILNIKDDLGINIDDIIDHITEGNDKNNGHVVIQDSEHKTKIKGRSSTKKRETRRFVPLSDDNDVRVKDKYMRIGLMTFRDKYDIYSACTATLIGKKWLLTAAHCLMDYITNHYTEDDYFFMDIYSFKWWAGISKVADPGWTARQPIFNYPINGIQYYTAEAFYVPRGYTVTNRGTDYDYALIELQTNAGDDVGYFSFGYNMNDFQLKSWRYVTAGYPDDMELFKMIYYKIPIHFVNKFRMYDDKYDHRSGGGQSGGSLWHYHKSTKTNTIYGVFHGDQKNPLPPNKNELLFKRINKINYLILNKIVRENILDPIDIDSNEQSEQYINPFNNLIYSNEYFVYVNEIIIVLSMCVCLICVMIGFYTGYWISETKDYDDIKQNGV